MDADSRCTVRPVVATRPRAGFSLVELLVALTLMGVGVAAWVGTSAAALRLEGEARRAGAAGLAARDRAERVASAGCATMASGIAPGERWTVDALAHGIRIVRVSRAFVGRAGADTARFARLVRC